MKFTSALGLLFLTSGLVHAKKLDQCKELKSQIEQTNGWINCENNEEGKINYLNIVDKDATMSEEDFAIVQNFDTITELIYGIYHDSNDSIELSGNENYFKILKNLKNLKNLEKLHIHYDNKKYDCTTNCNNKKDLTSIETGTFKDLKNLKELDVYGVKLSQDNIDEISTMVNLDTLQLDYCSFENVKDFSSLSNLEKVSFLHSYQTFDGYIESSFTGVPAEFVNQFKNVETLYVDYINNSTSSVDFKQFSNIKSLKIGHEDDISFLKNYSNLRYLVTPPSNDLTVLENVDSLEELEIVYKSYLADEDPYKKTNFSFSESNQIIFISLSGIEVTNENVEEILKLEHLKTIYFEYSDLSSVSDENILKLKELENHLSRIYYTSCLFRDGIEPLKTFDIYYRDDSYSTEIEYPTDYPYYTYEFEYPEPTDYYHEFENPEPEPTDYYTEFEDIKPTDYYTE